MTRASSINNAGTMTGWSGTDVAENYGAGTAMAFVRREVGPAIELQLPSPDWVVFPRRINAQEDVAAFTWPPNTQGQGAFYPTLDAPPEVHGGNYVGDFWVTDIDSNGSYSLGQWQYVRTGALTAWKFEGDGTDAVPKGDGHTSLNNLTIDASRFTSDGASGKALTFDGTDAQCFTFPINNDNELFGEPFTIMTWVKSGLSHGPHGCPSTPVPLFKRGLQFSLGLECGASGKDVVRMIADASANAVGPTIDEDTWVHLAVSYDHHRIRYYVNGISAGETTAESPGAASASSVFVGGCVDANVDFAGALDELVLFKQALRQDQIQLYQSGARTYPPLVTGVFWGTSSYDGISGETQQSVSIPLPGSVRAYPSAMNSQGEVVGTSVIGDPWVASYESPTTGLIDLNTLLPSMSDWTLGSANGINESHQIVGSGVHEGRNSAFSMDALTGQITDLGVLEAPWNSPSVSTGANAVNASGHIVGDVYYTGGFLPSAAFVYTRETGIVDLNDFVDPASGVIIRNASSINDSDEVVGYANLSNGAMRAYRMKLPAVTAIECLGLADGTVCDDHDACTSGETCHSGVCVVSTTVTCSASDACHVAGTCDRTTGTCSNPSAADGASCNDHNACTTGDACHTGACVAGTPVTCAQPGPCQTGGSCDATSGCAPVVAAADGTSCDDGNACTRTDTCQSGTCTGQNPVTCAADECRSAGTCDPATGACSSPPVAGGSCGVGVFDYDHAGRLVRDHATTITYDAYDQLRAVTPSASLLSNLPVTDMGQVPNGNFSIGYDINLNGEIAGTSYDPTVQHATVFAGNGPLVDIDALAGPAVTLGIALGINDAGTVTGSMYYGSTAHLFRFVLPDQYEDLGVRGDLSRGESINIHGQIAGTYREGVYHAFRYTDADGFLDLGDLGGNLTQGRDIDDDGRVVGNSRLSTTTTNPADPAYSGHAFIYDDVLHRRDLNDLIDQTTSPGWVLVLPNRIRGNYVFGWGLLNGVQRPFRFDLSTGEVFDPGVPGGPTGAASAYSGNSSGDIVGTTEGTATTGDKRAWVYIHGVGYKMLDDLIDPASGWTLQAALAINEAGDVTGYGTHDGVTSGFRLRLPLHTGGAQGPALAEVHTYGYDGLRTSTTTMNVDGTNAHTQTWFTQDYTQLPGGNREHYIRIGDRIVAKVTMAPDGSSGSGGSMSSLGGEQNLTAPKPSGGADSRNLFGGLAFGLASLAALAGFMRRRRGWVSATAAVMALLLTATSCEMFGVREKVAAAWFTDSSKTLYFHQGIAPGPTVITTSTGAVWEERRYEPFGQPIDARGAIGVAKPNLAAEPQNILGKLTDPNTGWSYHGARWMAPQTARWSAPDPAIKGPDRKHLAEPWDLNPYAYVDQKPTEYWDPDGRCAATGSSGECDESQVQTQQQTSVQELTRAGIREGIDKLGYDPFQASVYGYLKATGQGTAPDDIKRFIASNLINKDDPGVHVSQASAELADLELKTAGQAIFALTGGIAGEFGVGGSGAASRAASRGAGTAEESVNLASSQRTTHILTGDATGGGHLWPGQPGKTPFPQSWSGQKIMHHVSDVATDPALTWVQQFGKAGSFFTKAGDPARFVVTGVREGVQIKVVIEPMGEGIITAHPF
ncbi:MAG TPA: LamG-like jellyroll fold domain-containing protein [Polyangia bacterium]|nr:LamG-like jellyroll fold domain-containing protein [Polyangia bacterium]